MVTFGQQLRDALDRRHMDQGDLAALMDVSVRAVNDWVNDRAMPRNRMGALKKWAPELAGGEPPDPQEKEIAAMDWLTPAERDQWIKLYRARRAAPPPGRRAG